MDLETIKMARTALAAQRDQLQTAITQLDIILKTNWTAAPSPVIQLPDAPRVKRKYTRRVPTTFLGGEALPVKPITIEPPSPATIRMMEAATGVVIHSDVPDKPAKAPIDPCGPKTLTAAVKRYIRAQGASAFADDALKANLKLTYLGLWQQNPDPSGCINMALIHWTAIGKLEKLGKPPFVSYRMVSGQEGFFVETEA